jgi:hypothetical protein
LHRRAGDFAHGVRAALDVLNVQRGQNIDAGIKKFRTSCQRLG